MPREKKPPVLREQALAYLARREHSRAELSRKLEQAGHAPEDIAALLDDFEARNWLSDQRFAESYVADHRARSGPLKLAYELRQRGVADSIIETVLAETRGSELERARKIWVKKYGDSPVDGKIEPRQARFMLSRGFDLATVYQLFKNQVSAK